MKKAILNSLAIVALAVLLVSGVSYARGGHGRGMHHNSHQNATSSYCNNPKHYYHNYNYSQKNGTQEGLNHQHKFNHNYNYQNNTQDQNP